jgi:hypothetical protein
MDGCSISEHSESYDDSESADDLENHDDLVLDAEGQSERRMSIIQKKKHPTQSLRILI